MTARRIAVVVAAIVFVGGFFLAGRASVSLPGRAPARGAGAAERSSLAAVAAAANWLDASDTRAELLDPRHRRRLVAEQVAPDARARLSHELAAAAASLGRVSAGPPPPVVRAATLGYRLRNVDARHAVVDTWEVVARSALDIAPSVLWSRSQIRLRWDGMWRVTAARSRLQPLSAVDAAELADLDRRYRGFRHVP